MAEITFTIPNEKLSRVVDAINGLHPMPEEEEMTPAQWTKEYLRRLVVREVQAWERRVADSAVHSDDSIIS